MVTATEPANPWAFMNKPASDAAAQQAKKTYVTNYVKGTAADYSLPRIATGGIAPFVLGRDIIKNPDIMWYGNLQPQYEIKTEQVTVTDPNTGDETITTTVTSTITGYTIDIQFCTGLGPGCRLRTIFIDDAAVWTGTVGPARSTFTIVGNDYIKDVIFNGGNFDQAVDPYMQPLIPQALPAYRGISYVVFKAVDVAKLGNLSFEVDRYPDPLALGAHNKIGDDINVASAIAEIITRKWGGAGRDASILGTSFNTVAETLFTEGNGCSIINRNTVSANDLISILLSQIDATMWEDHETGKIELTPFRKDFDRTNLVRVFDRDITAMEDLSKGSWQSIPTSISIKYVDRAQNYGEIPLLARNLATSDKIAKNGVELSFPAVRTGTLAAKLLAREGASEGSPVQQIQMTTNRKTADSNPGDIILITYENYGYYSVPAIVTKRRTQPVEDNSVTITANVILYPNNTVLFAAPEASFFVEVDPSARTPIDVKIFNTAYLLRSPNGGPNGTTFDVFRADFNSATPVFVAKGANNAQANFRAYWDNGGVLVTFNPTPQVNANVVDFKYPLVGALNAAIDKYDNWDGTPMASVVIKNIGHPISAIDTIVNSLAVSGSDVNCYLFINNEIFMLNKRKNAASTFVYNNVANTITLTGLYRCMLDTVAQSHAANDYAYILTANATLENVASKGFNIAFNPDFKFTGFAYPKGVYTESPISVAFDVSTWVAAERHACPLRPHNTKISGSRGTSTPTALVLGSTPTISWAVRTRATPLNNLIRGTQTEASEVGEIFRAASRHLVYRVWIEDSAAVAWDCGATADTADHSSIVATIPLGAAVGVGWLWVDAEFDTGSGVKVSLYKDRLPIILS